MRRPVIAALCLAASALVWQLEAQPQASAGQSQLFNLPLSTQALPVPAVPGEHGPGMLTCTYYPHLMVKELHYAGDKGSALLSIATVQKDKADPACQLAPAEHEKQIGDWSGSFMGVIGDYVFFQGADGDGNGTPFAVYANGGERVFMDAGVLHRADLTLPVRDPEARPWYENPLALRYRRAYLAPCSLRSGGKTCWGLIQRVTGLTQAAPPDCRAAYEAEEKANPPQAALIRLTPSYLDYDAQAVFDSRGVIRVTPLGPVGQCHPAP
jgi:hypothetical protein